MNIFENEVDIYLIWVGYILMTNRRSFNKFVLPWPTCRLERVALNDNLVKDHTHIKYIFLFILSIFPNHNYSNIERLCCCRC